MWPILLALLRFVVQNFTFTLSMSEKQVSGLRNCPTYFVNFRLWNCFTV
jgi:hypothetical protein